MCNDRWLKVLLGICGAVLIQASAYAHETVYRANLLGASETPPAATPGNGIATVTIDFDLLTMRVQASFADLLGTTAAAHIHCCTTDPFVGNTGVATQLPSFSGFPLGVTSGTYDLTFDMAQSASYNAAFITANGGTVGTAFNALVAGLDAGKAYFNIHTSLFPGGEIRALLAPIPEPQTYALMMAGLLLSAIATRARKGRR